MNKLNRNDKLFLDKKETKESFVNPFLECRDGVVEAYEYRDASGYGSETRLFLCENVKQEVVAIIRQTRPNTNNEWKEEVMHFDYDSFQFLHALINGERSKLGGLYTLVRDYSREF